MSFYYDIILNWSEEFPFSFYEWNDYDYLELIKKIPFIKLKHKSFLDMVANNIKIDEKFLESIKDKTLVSDKNGVCKINYACLFTDGKSVIGIEFNNLGESISRSKMLVGEELEVLEASFGLKEEEVNYEILGKLEENKDLRQEREIKKVIFLEINNLYKNKEYAKLRYLFYEYKQEKLDDYEYIYNTLIKDLNENFTEKFFNIYNIIKLSYHNV